MKKLSIIMLALMALFFVQCDKNKGDDDANNNAKTVKVRCEIPISNDRSDFTNLMSDGSIKWSKGIERLYVAVHHATKPQIVEMKSADMAQTSNVLVFEGEIEEGILAEGEEYEVWYLGNSMKFSDDADGNTEPYINKTVSGGVLQSISGSISNQSGSLSDLGLCHIASTKATAFEESDGSFSLPRSGVLSNKIAIAYMNLSGITQLSGTAIKGTEYTLAYNNGKYEFSVVADADAKINVTNGTATSYVVLFPNSGNDLVIESNTDKELTLADGVAANSIYYKQVSAVEKAPLDWNQVVDPEQPITISASKNTLSANGTDAVTFTVTQGGNNVTAQCSIYVNGGLLNGSSFSTTTSGSYSVYATKNGVTSNTIYITAEAVASGDTEIVFADGVTLNSGWYDVNKLTNGGADIQMCWAASAANIIQWWQDRYVAAGNALPAGAVSGAGTKVYPEGYAYNLALMEIYRDSWTDIHMGSYPDQAVIWYFEGRNIQSNAAAGSCSQPNASGGYFSSVWSQLLANDVYDGYTNGFSGEFGCYYLWAGGSGLTGDASLKKFSDYVVDFIDKGVISLTISLGINGGLLHATTLWGYEIDKNTGLLTKVWLTDSDDIHQGSSSGDPTQKMLREYTVSYDGSSLGRIKLSGEPYGSCWAMTLFPFSGYGSK